MARDGEEAAGIMIAPEFTVLVRKAQAGDKEAWEKLYRQYAPAIFRFCRRALPTPQDAEDATSEIFIKVGRNLGRYDLSRPFAPWLYKVASNHCWDLLRRRRIREDLEDAGPEELLLMRREPDQLARLEMDQESRQVREGLSRLPDRARMALVMRYYSEMSYDEIAEALGIERTFVGVVLLRARRQLGEVLARSSAHAAEKTGCGEKV